MSSWQGVSLHIWVKISVEWGVPSMGITVSRPGCVQHFSFAPPTLAQMGGWRSSILLGTCARNVSCLSRTVSITSVSLGSAGAWWLSGWDTGTSGGLWAAEMGKDRFEQPGVAWQSHPRCCPHVPYVPSTGLELFSSSSHCRLASAVSQPLRHCGGKQRGALGVAETSGNSPLSSHIPVGAWGWWVGIPHPAWLVPELGLALGVPCPLGVRWAQSGLAGAGG